MFDLKHSHMILVEPHKVRRVFSNILSNAVQAVGRGGHIWFNTKEDGKQIVFCIGNSNSFISNEDHSRLFEAFFTKNKKGGTGLGLAIAQKVVQAHGGEIWCKSSLEKMTVEFFFSLPIE